MGDAAYSQLNLVTNAKANYRIVIPAKSDKNEQDAAAVLKKYIAQISGADMLVVTDDQPATDLEITIGKTNRALINDHPKNDGFILQTINQRLCIYGDKGKGVLYGVYHLLDKYLGCRKYTPTLSYIPKQSSITVNIKYDLQEPQFEFRSVYYPGQYDAEYRDWHHLHLIDDDWGLWGHSFDKLVPPGQYFKSHPEYYALVNGERMPTQLCLSNPAVYQIAVKTLTTLVHDHPEKKYWSVSQNDGLGYCTCNKCAAIDKKHGGPQGSIVSFVNKVAKNFPDKSISTLAYLYSKHPPVNLKPAKNVSIMLSSIDLNRAKPIATDPSANGFRNDLKGWTTLSKNVMLWDYVVQFTNFLSPFPNMQVLKDNTNYFYKAGLTGVFLQGTETEKGEFADLKSYLLARQSWGTNANATTDADEFMQAYYGKAAPYIKSYQTALYDQLNKSNRVLDIYGEPTSEWNSWLTPELIDNYSILLDQAENAVANSSAQLKRVLLERLPLEFAVLQQARFYGIEQHGIFNVDGSKWSIRPGFENKVTRFINSAQSAGIKNLNEDGLTLDGYREEWSDIFKKGPLLHMAVGKNVKAVSPFNTDYPAKGTRTLTDGIGGYNNFQYNYLGWLGNDMEVVIDLEEIKNVQSVSAGFLEDQRHWAFLPTQVTVELSDNGTTFKPTATVNLPQVDENYAKETHRVQLKLPANSKARYIRIKAKNLKELPSWRNMPNRKPWLFCDEVEVN